MKKTTRVVMLATEKALVIGDLIIEVDRPNILVKYTGTASFMKTPIPQELYLISDDEIKEGDWVVCDYGNEKYVVGKILRSAPPDAGAGPGWFVKYNITNEEQPWDEYALKKIVATTDNSINVNYPIAEIPESFIQAYIKAYNEGSPITEVAVEMTTGELEANSVGLSLNGGGNRPFIKTRSDNTVIIHQAKNYSFEEMEAYAMGKIKEFSIYRNSLTTKTYTQKQVENLCEKAFRAGREAQSNLNANRCPSAWIEDNLK